MPSDYIVEVISGFLKEKFPEPQNVKVVDISCGDGKLVKKLRNEGFDAGGTNWGSGIFPHDVKHEDIPCDYGVNVLDGLPYADESFDAVVNSEILEHIENHRLALSEMCRVVRKGGYLMFSTPNISRLSSRLRYFLTGFHKVRYSHAPFDLPEDHAARHHNFPVHLPFAHWLLFVKGFRLRKICWNKARVFAIILSCLLYPLIFLSLVKFLFTESTLKAKGGNRELFRLMIHPAILMCSLAILAYQKT